MFQGVVHIREETNTIDINNIINDLIEEDVNKLLIICHSELSHSQLEMSINNSEKIREISLISNLPNTDDRNHVIHFKSIHLNNLPNLYQFVVDHTCNFEVDSFIIENIRNSLGFWSNSLSAKSCVLKNTSGNFNISAENIEIIDSTIMYLKIRSTTNLNTIRSDIKTIEIIEEYSEILERNRTFI